MVSTGVLAAGDGGDSIAASTPRLGLVPEEAQMRVRGILGIPGAARFGPAREFQEPVRRGLVAPNHGYVLLVRGDGLAVLPSEIAVNEVPAALGEGGDGLLVAGSAACVDLWAFSPSGEAFAAYCRERGTVQVVAGLPTEPRVTAELATAKLGAPLVNLALNDEGSKVVAVTENGEAHLMNQDGLQMRFMWQMSSTAISFLPHRSDFLISDAERGEVWRYLVIYGAPQGKMLWRAEKESGSITQVWVGEGAVAYFYAGKAGRAWKVNLTTGEAVELAMPGGADMFLPLADRDQFLVSARPGEPAWLCDAAGESMKCWLIPAATEIKRVKK